MTADAPSPAPVRCSASDLRLQWSSAHNERRRDPAALERLRGRVATTEAALADELTAAATPAARAALKAEIAQVREVAAAIARADERGKTPAIGRDGVDDPAGVHRGCPAPGGGDQ